MHSFPLNGEISGRELRKGHKSPDLSATSGEIAAGGYNADTNVRISNSDNEDSDVRICNSDNEDTDVRISNSDIRPLEDAGVIATVKNDEP